MIQAGGAGPGVDISAYQRPLLRLSPSLFPGLCHTGRPGGRRFAPSGKVSQPSQGRVVRKKQFRLISAYASTDLPPTITLCSLLRAGVQPSARLTVTGDKRCRYRNAGSPQSLRHLRVVAHSTDNTNSSALGVGLRRSAQQRRVPGSPKGSPGCRRPRPAR